MGLFDFFKKKEAKPEPQENSLLLAMPLFNNGDTFDFSKIVDHLKDFWSLPVGEHQSNESSSMVKIDGHNIIIAGMPVPVPKGDIDSTAAFAYNWPTASADLENHTGHAIVTLMSNEGSAFERFTLFSKVLYSLLATSNAVGIYHGTQSLLISRDQYLAYTEELKANQVALMLWVYIGYQHKDDANSIYTYGLKSFNKKEIEIINSALSMDELFNFITNIAAYVIGSDVTLKNGETLGYTADQKIKITESDGVYVEGKTLKLQM